MYQVTNHNGGIPTQAQLRETRRMMQELISARGFANARVFIEGTDKIRVQVPDVGDTGKLFRIIGNPAQIEFRNQSGDVIFTGREVDRVNSNIDTATGMYAVFLSLNAAGTMAFGLATMPENIGKLFILLLL